MSERLLDGLVAAKFAIAEIEGGPLGVAGNVFKAIRERLNEMIAEEMEQEAKRLRENAGSLS